MSDDPVHRFITPDERHQIEKRLRVRFRNPAWLVEAFMHASFINRSTIQRAGFSGGNRPLKPNERLEFVGDALIEAFVRVRLFRLSRSREGALTQIKDRIVSNDALASITRKLELEQFIISAELLQSRREHRRFIGEKTLADLFEAIVAAIYFDRDQSAVDAFLEYVMLPTIQQAVEQAPSLSAKVRFEAYVREQFRVDPEYITGQPHEGDPEFFCVEILVNNESVGYGSGTGKGKPFQEALLKAMQYYGIK